jgi:hypothetical protein
MPPMPLLQLNHYNSKRLLLFRVLNPIWLISRITFPLSMQLKMPPPNHSKVLKRLSWGLNNQPKSPLNQGPKLRIVLRNLQPLNLLQNKHQE